MERFQQKFSKYLGQLAEDLRDKFIGFILKDNEQSLASMNMDQSTGPISNNANSICTYNIDLVRQFWTTETLAKITLNLNEFGTEEFTYVIQIIYKDASYRIQKRRHEAVEFYDKMVNSFQTYSLKRPSSAGKVELPIDKAALKDVEYFHTQVLNNADLFCDDVWDYFGYKATETPRCLHSLLQIQGPILKDFKVVGSVGKAEFGLDERRNVQIVS